MATVAKKLRPKVEQGVVKHDRPVRSQEIRQFSAPPVPVKSARSVSPPVPLTQQQQDAQQQKIDPQKVVRRRKGCSGCRRKIGG